MKGTMHCIYSGNEAAANIVSTLSMLSCSLVLQTTQIIQLSWSRETDSCCGT